MLPYLNKNNQNEEHTESEKSINKNARKSKSTNNFLSIETISCDHQLPNSNNSNSNDNNNNNNTVVINQIPRRPSIFDYINEEGLHGLDESSHLLNYSSSFLIRDEPNTRIKASMSHGNFDSQLSPSSHIPFLQVSLVNDGHEYSCTLFNHLF
jgi:hypothetical protein